MPFPIVYGIPPEATPEELTRLHSAIVKTVAETMGCPENWVRPIFPKDLLDAVEFGPDVCDTIYARLDTAMFNGKTDVDELANKVIAALAKVIWDAFYGMYEVEVFVGDLNAKWKCLLEARE